MIQRREGLIGRSSVSISKKNSQKPTCLFWHGRASSFIFCAYLCLVINLLIACLVACYQTSCLSKDWCFQLLTHREMHFLYWRRFPNAHFLYADTGFQTLYLTTSTHMIHDIIIKSCNIIRLYIRLYIHNIPIRLAKKYHVQ